MEFKILTALLFIPWHETFINNIYFCFVRLTFSTDRKKIKIL